jgi:hypothetical protein
MAHYALIASNNIVVNVITGIDEDDTSTLPEEFSSWEEFYGDLHNLTCKRTSYNTYKNQHSEGGTPLRGNYAGKGFVYDSDNDVFYEPQPYDSWTLDTSTWSWQPPINYPDDGQQYVWNENAHRGDTNSPKTVGWELINL